MNLSSFIVLGIVIVITVLVIMYLVKHKHAGCGGDCNHCGLGSCEHEDIYKKFYQDHPKKKH